jgi:hypothetical protein
MNSYYGRLNFPVGDAYHDMNFFFDTEIRHHQEYLDHKAGNLYPAFRIFQHGAIVTA